MASILLPNCSVRFDSADFFRILLNSSVRFAEQFGKILAEQFGSAEFEIGKVRFCSVRRKNSEFGSPLGKILKGSYYQRRSKALNIGTLGILINVHGRLTIFGKFASQKDPIWPFFQKNTKIWHTLNLDYCSMTSNTAFCTEISPLCDHLAKYGSYFQENFPPRTII